MHHHHPAGYVGGNHDLDGKMTKEYIGDGVYARVDRHGDIVVATEDGIRETNKIVLEPEIADALADYLMRAKAERQAA